MCPNANLQKKKMYSCSEHKLCICYVLTYLLHEKNETKTFTRVRSHILPQSAKRTVIVFESKVLLLIKMPRRPVGQWPGGTLTKSTTTASAKIIFFTFLNF